MKNDIAVNAYETGEVGEESGICSRLRSRRALIALQGSFLRSYCTLHTLAACAGTASRYSHMTQVIVRKPS